ncbi:MAG: DUF4412 domain-containing protein [Deltaproteobacteria bacterium]|nr:DUF4412 domain-containing protein [Deltaproteobacteria bacterium]
MKKKFVGFVGFATLFLIILTSGYADADVFMKNKQHSDAMQVVGQNQPAKDVVETTWFTPKGFRSDSPENSVILHLDQKKMIMIDHTGKTYTEMPLDMNKMMPEGGQQNTEQQAALQGMMKNMMKMDVTVAVAGEKKKIKGWKCEKYIVTMKTFMGVMTNEIWATEDLKVDKEIYARMGSSMMTGMPGMQNSMEDMTREMKKIKGVRVYTTMTQDMMGQKIRHTTELLEFKKGKAPAGLFKTPKGYQKKTAGM